MQLIEGAVTVYDLNRQENKKLAPQRAEFWKEKSGEQALAEVRRIAGFRSLSLLPKATVKLVGTIDRKNYKIEKLLIQAGPDIVIPACRLSPGPPPPDAPDWRPRPRLPG